MDSKGGSDREGSTIETVSDAQIAEALESHHGVKSAAARTLGIDRRTLEKRVREAPDLQAKCLEINEAISDQATIVILRAISQNNVGVAEWWLDRQARHRGFGKVVEGRLDQRQMDALLLALFGNDVARLKEMKRHLESE